MMVSWEYNDNDNNYGEIIVVIANGISCTPWYAAHSQIDPGK